MKNKRALEIDRRAKFCVSSENPSVTNHLGGFCRDLEANQRWKYDELSPVHLLEKLKLDEYPTDKGELARAEFFWSRRPRLLTAIDYIVWLTVALGLPFWLFIVPAIGVPLLIIAALVVPTGRVRALRGRREDRLKIDRSTRHIRRAEASRHTR